MFLNIFWISFGVLYNSLSHLQDCLVPLSQQVLSSLILFPLQISVDRGMPWDEAYNRSLKVSGPDEGFYLSLKVSPGYDKQTKPEVCCNALYVYNLLQNSNVMTQQMSTEMIFSVPKTNNSLSVWPLHSCEVTTHVCCWLSKGEARTSLSTSPTLASRPTLRAWTTCSNVTGR